MRDDLSARDRNRVDPRMPEDETFVHDQVGFPGGSIHFESLAFAARAPRNSGVSNFLVGGRKRFRFLDFHFAIATLETAGAGLVAEHFRAALFAQVTLAEYVCHLVRS